MTPHLPEWVRAKLLIRRPETVFKRTLVFVHRWLGVALSAMLTMWFVSGIVMMYWGYPALQRSDYLRHAPRLHPEQIALSPTDAFGTAAAEQPAGLTLTSFDGRPIYYGSQSMVYADDGSTHVGVDQNMVDRAAAAWTGRPLHEATRTSVDEVDQWTLGDGLRSLMPLQKYSWPDGQQVYMDGKTAEVVQYTTRGSRFWAYFGAIPHWLYVPALRTREVGWMALMTWGAVFGLVTTLAGLALGIWMLSPRRRYRRQGVAAALPYSGWKRWHTVLGLVGGVTAVTWIFSGLASLQPFGVESWLLKRTVSERMDDEAYNRVYMAISNLLLDRSRDLSEYAAKGPGEAIASLRDFETKVLEFASLDGAPVYLATDGDGDTRLVPVRGEPMRSVDIDDLAQRVRRAAGAYAQVTVLDRYDMYYRDRKGQLPLPVISVAINDSVQTHYYVDPKTVSIVDSYSARDWVHRWLHHGLHSFDLPWLYNHRPLWDIVMVTLLLAGTALCATSLLLAYRVLARTGDAWTGPRR